MLEWLIIAFLVIVVWSLTIGRRNMNNQTPERCPVTVTLGNRLIGQWTLTAKDANSVCRMHCIDKLLSDGDPIDIEVHTELAANEIKADVEFYLDLESI